MALCTDIVFSNVVTRGGHGDDQLSSSDKTRQETKFQVPSPTCIAALTKFLHYNAPAMGGGYKWYCDLSVCPSPRRAAALGYRYAGCLQLSHVWTADWTDIDLPWVELPSAGGTSSRHPQGNNLSFKNDSPNQRQLRSFFVHKTSSFTALLPPIKRKST